MTTRDIIRKFIEENMTIYDNPQFADDANIFELGFVDSMFALKLVTFIESEFKLTVDNEDLNLKNFCSVENIENFIASKNNKEALQ